ncbi:serine/threonine-protein kinase [Geitlerinema splendidum]|nr:serine/threonine-protein kinase [Geitlerinema splendidum]
MNNPIQHGILLGDRYRIVRELGHGGFGRTYLAEDTNRFNEPCVLKEFAPKVQGTYALQKGQELFEREAGVLYKLQHAQIPRFRELFRAKLGNESYLFLVQDFVEGKTYRALLDARKQQGMVFNENEVQQLLVQLLPVLSYIHALNVIHRDISPDNLMLRHADLLPVLIDFGGVKQVAATVESQFTEAAVHASPTATRLGKVGYAPDEQMHMGLVYPHSDLYALAVTAIVLLTGKEPQQLIDPYTLRWNWHSQAQISPKLREILDRMLAQRPADRFSSAQAVLQALRGEYISPAPAPAPSAPPYTQPPPTAATEATQAMYPPVSPASAPLPPAKKGGIGQVLVILLLLVGAGGMGWWGANAWLDLQNRPDDPETPIVEEPSPPPPEDPLSETEIQRKEALRQRRERLGIDRNFYVGLVNREFYNENPQLGDRQLTSGPEDAELRAQWDRIASELLDRLEPLSSQARQRLGSFSSSDIDRWRSEINQRHLGSRSLNDLTDARFKAWFGFLPLDEFANAAAFLRSPYGQIWQAIASDYVQAIAQGTALERITFNPGETGTTVRGSLQPGEGKAYVAQLANDQVLRVNLQAPNQATLLSVYPPSGSDPALLEDSVETSLTVSPTKQGFYEFVAINQSLDPIDYQLTIEAQSLPMASPPPATTP